MATDTVPEKWPFVLRSPEFKQKIKQAKLLCVGAGGIGCELLKTLTLTGFENLEVIDLDTIDTSNLNRQFLFRKHHVGQAKSKVAAEVVQGFRPQANIVSYQDNVKSSKFDVNYFRKFDVVLNGLDNLEARRHVNRLCLAAECPLIESGTTGYLGQVRVHLKGVTECYECQEKPVQKSYPICTIRNTPDKPIHCIVWAKDILFQRLFGHVDETTDLDEVVREGPGEGEGEEAGVLAADAEQQKQEASAFLRQEGESSSAYAARIFDIVYREQIENLLKMDELWTTRAQPKMLNIKELVLDVEALAKGEEGGSAARSIGLKDPQQVWSVAENARVFVRSIIMFLEQRASELGSAQFDKDDQLAVDFVTAASNLRSECYSIPQQSSFDAKGMAGNIIHAIATTNAIVSGFMATEALKVLAGLPYDCKDSYLNHRAVSFRRRGVPKSELIKSTNPSEPNPQCVVCGRAQVELRVNTHTAKLGLVVEQVLKKRLAFTQPYIMLDSSVIYEEGEDLKEEDEEQWKAFQSSLGKTLQDLPAGGIKHGSMVSVEDTLQDFKLEVIVSHEDEIDEEEHPEGFILIGGSSKPQPATPTPASNPHTASTSGAGTSGVHPDDAGPSIIIDEDDDIELIEDPQDQDLEGKGKEADVKGKGKEADVKGKGKEADVKGKGKEADVKGKGKEADVKGKGKEADVKGKGKEADVKGKGKEADVKGKGKEADVKGKGKEADVKGKGKEADVKGKGKAVAGKRQAPPSPSLEDEGEGEGRGVVKRARVEEEADVGMAEANAAAIAAAVAEDLSDGVIDLLDSDDEVEAVESAPVANGGVGLKGGEHREEAADDEVIELD